MTSLQRLAVPLVGCLLAAVGCGARTDGATLSVPVSFAEGHGEDASEPGAAALDPAQHSAPHARPPTEIGPRSAVEVARKQRGSLPDPAPTSSAIQYEYTFSYRGGEIALMGVSERTYARPRAAERRMGRYAVELWIGRELLERVRFDFPGATTESTPEQTERQSLREPVDLSRGLHVQYVVRLPHNERATRAVLVDRATGRETPLEWPPLTQEPSTPQERTPDAAAPGDGPRPESYVPVRSLDSRARLAIPAPVVRVWANDKRPSGAAPLALRSAHRIEPVQSNEFSP